MAACPLGLMLAYGFISDWRWIIVAASIMVIIIPAVQFLGWMHTLSTPGASDIPFPCIITINSGTKTLLATYKSRPRQKKDSEGKKGYHDYLQKEEEQEEEENMRCPGPALFRFSDIVHCEPWKRYLAITCKVADGYRLILIPVTAFKTRKDAGNAYLMLEKNITRQHHRH